VHPRHKGHGGGWLCDGKPHRVRRSTAGGGIGDGDIGGAGGNKMGSGKIGLKFVRTYEACAEGPSVPVDNGGGNESGTVEGMQADLMQSPSVTTKNRQKRVQLAFGGGEVCGCQEEGDCAPNGARGQWSTDG
jgi:hypothetical protein